MFKKHYFVCYTLLMFLYYEMFKKYLFCMQYFVKYEIDVSFYFHNFFLVLSFGPPQVRILVPSLSLNHSFKVCNLLFSLIYFHNLSKKKKKSTSIRLPLISLTSNIFVYIRPLTATLHSRLQSNQNLFFFFGYFFSNSHYQLTLT